MFSRLAKCAGISINHFFYHRFVSFQLLFQFIGFGKLNFIANVFREINSGVFSAKRIMIGERKYFDANIFFPPVVAIAAVFNIENGLERFAIGLDADRVHTIRRHQFAFFLNFDIQRLYVSLN